MQGNMKNVAHTGFESAKWAGWNMGTVAVRSARSAVPEY